MVSREMVRGGCTEIMGFLILNFFKEYIIFVTKYYLIFLSIVYDFWIKKLGNLMSGFIKSIRNLLKTIEIKLNEIILKNELKNLLDKRLFLLLFKNISF